MAPLRGRCHCGATEFELASPPTSVTQCNCSFCSKRGALWAYYPPEQVRLLKTEQAVGYATPENAEVGRHHHCGICGCSTYSEFKCTWDAESMQPDFSRPKISINARLLENFDLDSVPINHVDGRNLW